MKPEYKQKWIEALQSGKYKFGKDKLYDPNQKCFCVLGVLADVVAKEFPERYCWEGNNLWDKEDDSEVYYDYYLPESIVKITSLSSQEGEIDPYNTTIAAINDESDSFDRVIKVIEEHF